MRISTVAELLSGHLSASEFSAEIAPELAEHARQLAIKGASAPVVVVEDVDLLVDQQCLAALLNLFSSGQLTASELAYTADALQLAERVHIANSGIADALAECADPAVNGVLTVERARDLACGRHAV